MQGSLADQTAVVTGAAGGIGLAVAKRLGQNGASVALVDRDAPRLREGRDELEELGIAAEPIEGDVRESTCAASAVERALATFGSVDILVNAAGVIRDATIERIVDADWDDVHAINLKAPFAFCRAAVPSMRERGYGRIVNISSRAWLGGFGQTSYSASKGGLVSMTRSLALELARDGITANTVAPGTIDTPMFRSFPPAVQDRLRASQPSRRLGTPEEVAAAVHFLASADASFVTGQTLHVCGGRSLVVGPGHDA
jgi:3-oxoacyl-[acyl-carrier protein] reductase